CLAHAGAAPILAAFEAQRDGLTVAPMGGVGPGYHRRGDKVQIFGIRRRAAGPIVGPGQRTAPSMTIVLACAIRAMWSIQTGTPAPASGSMPLWRPQVVLLSAISLTSTPRRCARTSASTMPDPVVRP